MSVQWPLARKPHAVQAEAFSRAIERPKFGLWMEQGLGKTTTQFALFLHGLLTEDVDAMIVVAPTYLKSGWRDEARDINLGIPVFCWPEKVTRPDKPHVFVINPEALRNSGGVYVQELLQSGRRYRVALDEPQIKNFNGAASKNIFSTFSGTFRRNELTGTPMPHNVMDLWAMLRFIGELNGVNPYAFRNRYAVQGGFKGKQITGVKNEEQLHGIINRCAFRALKADWWDGMPEKLYAKREFEMLPKQREIYRTMQEEFFAQVDLMGEEIEVYAEQVSHAMMKLQQISRGFIMDNGAVHQIVTDDENPALKVVKQELELTPGKVIIFAFHKHSVDMLERALQDRQPAVLRGGMTEEDIAAVKYRFNNDSSCRTFIAQTSVGARGHTLLGQPGNDRCSTTLFYENTYDMEQRLQAEDRNHRFGQDRGVLYVDLFGSSIDYAKVDALQKRQDLIHAVVDVARNRRK